MLRANLLVDLVRLHDAIGNRAAAHVEVVRAAATLAGLDVVLPAADAELLERYGAAPRGAPTRRTVDLAPDDRGWVVSCGDVRARPRHQGAALPGRAPRSPGVERHALDLVDRVEGVAADRSVDRRPLGDAGEVADAQARESYRRRIEALRAEIDDALTMGADDRAVALEGELEMRVGRPAEAFGLGGRGRRVASASERARLNVTRALRAAASRLAEAVPEVGTTLDSRLRTGIYCAYEPDGADEVRWVVHC